MKLKFRKFPNKITCMRSKHLKGESMREPDFERNLAKVLKKEKPENPTLFEFLLSEKAEEVLSGYRLKSDSEEERIKRRIYACLNAGYDFVPVLPSGLLFEQSSHQSGKETYSLNEGGLITDRESYEKYKWPDMEAVSYRYLEVAKKYLPDGMKVLSCFPNGILENVIGICGYENLCFMLADDREPAAEIFRQVGSRLEKYLKNTLDFDCVGMTFCNDDWGFKQSTMISHNDLREFVYPYYRETARATHEKGKYIGMHSCGNSDGIFEELYGVIGFDGKHSYEDVIMPVEEAYEKYKGKIAVLGGIDVDFICRHSEKEIADRCRHMLEISENYGGYALGTGNSVTRYMPLEKYFALLKVVNPDLKIN